MIKSAESNIKPNPEFDIFIDDNSQVNTKVDSKDTPSREYSSKQIPKLEKIVDYFNYIFKKAMMESECIIITLIYIERLFVATGGE